MKKTLLLTIVSSLGILAFSQAPSANGTAAIWNVVAGGTPDVDTPDPYFDPQNIVIQVGDIVIWENIQGWHNIETTSGPDDFSFGPAGSGWTHEFTFTMAGIYTYECGVGEHALTQFGSITVEMADDITEHEPGISLHLSPNPASTALGLNLNSTSGQAFDIKLINALGQTVWYRPATNDTVIRIDVSSFERGMYIVVLQSTDGIQTEKVLLK